MPQKELTFIWITCFSNINGDIPIHVKQMIPSITNIINTTVNKWKSLITCP